MKSTRVQGLVVRVTGHEIWVDADGRQIACVLRGRFRQKSKAVQVVAGDHVEIALPASAGAHGAIEAVLPRKTYLSRYTGGRASAERVIVANIDKLFVVASLRSPDINLPFLDRVLISAERGNNDIQVCLNKIDLVTREEDIAGLEQLYRSIGYRVLRASAKTGEGIDEIKSIFTGKVYAFVGQSGVGKSSLLNRIDPGLELRVSDVAHKTGRGRHTTAYSQLFPLQGGFVTDTPGMQTFEFPGLEWEDLAPCFPEFRKYIGECRFQPCTHSHEPGCALKEAVEGGAVFASRYQSYLAMLADVEERSKNRY
jgi:ribosome biogenesis GTPase